VGQEGKLFPPSETTEINWGKKPQSISTIIKDERHGKYLMNLVMALSFMLGKCLGVKYWLNGKSSAPRSLPQ